MATYSMYARLSGSYVDVKAWVVDALKEQSFAILSEINVQRTLENKLGVEIERYEILGACDPHLAYQALEADRAIGLLLPCNVVLREVDDAVAVSVLDPEWMFAITDDRTKAVLAALPGEAKARLEAALSALKGGLR